MLITSAVYPAHWKQTLPTEQFCRIHNATSKLCNLLFAYELDRKLKASGRQTITVNGYDPGAVPATNLLNSLKNLFIRALLRLATHAFRPFGVTISTPEKSGAAMARLLLAPQFNGVSGTYFQLDRKRNSSVASYNQVLASQLWEDSLTLTGLNQAVVTN